jgi:hypothetical protein
VTDILRLQGLEPLGFVLLLEKYDVVPTEPNKGCDFCFNLSEYTCWLLVDSTILLPFYVHFYRCSHVRTFALAIPVDTHHICTKNTAVGLLSIVHRDLRRQVATHWLLRLSRVAFCEFSSNLCLPCAATRACLQPLSAQNSVSTMWQR